MVHVRHVTVQMHLPSKHRIVKFLSAFDSFVAISNLVVNNVKQNV